MAVYTAREVAEQFGSTESFIKDLARRQLVPCLRVGRGAYRFTDDHVAAIRTHLEQPVKPPDDDRYLTTSRSRARRRSA
jgi:hypothetical protein